MKKRPIVARVRIASVWFYSAGTLLDIKNSVEDIGAPANCKYQCYQIALLDGRPLAAIARPTGPAWAWMRILLSPKKPHKKIATVNVKDLRKRVFALAKAKLEANRLGRRSR